MISDLKYKITALGTAKACVSIGLLTLALWLLDWDGLTNAFQQLDWLITIAALGVLLLEFPVLGFRWVLLVKHELPLTKYEIVRRYFIAVFFSTFTPAQIGTDAHRFFDLKKAGAHGSRLIGLMIYERIVGLGSFIIFFLACFAFAWTSGQLLPTSEAWIIFMAAPILTLVGTLLMFGHKLLPVLSWISFRLPSAWVTPVMDGARAALAPSPVGGRYGVWLLSVCGGCVIWMIAVWLIAVDVGAEIPIAVIGITAILTDLVRLLPISIQGIGIREITFAYLFQAAGYSAEDGFVVGIVAYALVGLAVILIGVIGYLLPRNSSPKSP